jgi:hypothetical protein
MVLYESKDHIENDAQQQALAEVDIPALHHPQSMIFSKIQFTN